MVPTDQSSNTPRERFQPLMEAVRNEKTVEGKLDALSTMVFMIATNDLTCLENKQKELDEKLEDVCKGIDVKFKRILVIGVGILVSVLLQVPIDNLIKLIGKIL